MHGAHGGGSGEYLEVRKGNLSETLNEHWSDDMGITVGGLRGCTAHSVVAERGVRREEGRPSAFACVCSWNPLFSPKSKWTIIDESMFEFHGLDAPAVHKHTQPRRCDVTVAVV